MNKLYFALILLISLGMSSCETDIDINADYKDITTVYGLIDPTDTIHYLKINKAFLGEGSALDLAANADNFNYAVDELIVTIESYDESNVLKKTYSAERTVDAIVKNPGIFDNSTNVLYKFTESSINRNYKYLVRIVNTTLNKEVTTETKIVGATTISSSTTDPKFKFWNGTVSTGDYLNKGFEVRVGADVGRAGANLVFNYTEFYTNGMDSTFHSVIMPLGDVQTTSPIANQKLDWVLKGETFFENINAAVSDGSAVSFFAYRRLENISLEFSVGGTELSTYMEVSAPSSSVNQDKPEYTNVENGLGIFSSRENISWASTLNPFLSKNINIQNSTIRYLELSSLLTDKGFCFGTFDPNTSNNPDRPCD
jgi:hypothetical protein